MQATFNVLDEDGNGVVSREEAQGHANITVHWERIDRNGDGRMDRAEFSAFEQSQGQPGGGMGSSTQR